MVFLQLFKDLSSNICCLEERRATERSKHCSLFSSALALLVGSGVCVCAVMNLSTLLLSTGNSSLRPEREQKL